MSIDYSKREYLPDKRKYSNSNKNLFFLKKKIMKQLGNSPLSNRSPLLTNPLSLSNFFMSPLFVQILKARNLPNFNGRGNYEYPPLEGKFVSYKHTEGE